MAVFRVEVMPRDVCLPSAASAALATELQDAGLVGVRRVHTSRLFFLEGSLTRDDASAIACRLLTDPVTEYAAIQSQTDSVPAETVAGLPLEVHPRLGVMDPVAQSTFDELRAEGYAIEAVRTARRYIMDGLVDASLAEAAARIIANDCVEEVVLGSAAIRPAPRPPALAFEPRRIALRDMDDTALADSSRRGHLFLSIEEMRVIRDFYRNTAREPTDLELETLAQTWSEHCVHKTLKSTVIYRGAPLPPGPGRPAASSDVELGYQNLLSDTIARVTRELIADGRGPECLSVFADNAGVIGFDDEFGIAFKVETHNHPSAIEPYGGAATGIGGCIRDVMGCGLGARPVANTDVFCVAPSDWPRDRLPKGVLHPRRVLRGIVQGVADYGNRMGIPTVNGTVCYDPRFLGNPLVYCGCVGSIPRDMVSKAARPGDRVVLIGGRTGRDGIHGATFSSAELTDTHADEFSHAVQIGNAITEKRCLDAMLRARDHESGCLHSATTDCGAGGLSSAVGEMGAEIGVDVELSEVPLKYAGLRYDEIWISEAQERMVLAVPPRNLDTFLRIMAEEEVEATVIGTFGCVDPATDQPRLVVRYQGHVVGDLDMRFVHEGLPAGPRMAEWHAPTPVHSQPREVSVVPVADDLIKHLRHPNTGGKHWIIRGYDHEVQGGSVIKPLCGPGLGPSDAALLCPRLGSPRGIAIGCGLAPHLSDVDPYWMAVAAIDEALRNIVAVGGDPENTAILDNFCWGSCEHRQQLGALVRACQACYDTAKVFGVPFISGKDSLNNEFALDDGDVDVLIETLREMAESGGGTLPQACAAAVAQVRSHRRLRIPPTLLISAISIVADVGRCVTPDLKCAGGELLLVGGLPQVNGDLSAAHAVHQAVSNAIRSGDVRACHDVSDGGWLVALAEMAIAGNRGVLCTAFDQAPDPFEQVNAAYVVELCDAERGRAFLAGHGAAFVTLGRVSDNQCFSLGEAELAVSELRSAWSGTA